MKKKNTPGVLNIIGFGIVIFFIVTIWTGMHDKNESDAKVQKTNAIPETNTTPETNETITVKAEEHPQPNWEERTQDLYIENIASFPGIPSAGSKIIIHLKNGGEQTGVFCGISNNAVILKNGPTTIEINQSSLAAATRVRLWKEDFSKIKTLKMLKAEKDEWQKVEEERFQKAVEQSKIQQFNSSFVPYDGRHIILELYIKESLHDPKSYKHTSTALYDGDSTCYKKIITTYRAKNALGALIITQQGATLDERGNIIDFFDVE
jgi:hypothetical protein